MKLIKMVLRNFMAYPEDEIDFSDITKISGRNGAGKSSIASAYTWVLFDCDYNLKSSPAVRREVTGSPVMDSDVEVTLIFDLDILDLLAELEKKKNELLSDEINSHFGLVKWKLFENAKNGNYKSVCIPQVDGKSILTTISNKGNRILGKLDICRSIQKIEGISVPIWLDDCESLDSENQKKVRQ